MADLDGLRVDLVLGPSTGGIGRHVRALAGLLAESGASVGVYGPAATEELFDFSAAGADFTAVDPAGAGPLAALTAAATLRRRLRGPAPRRRVAHAHGWRAGALSGLAAGGTPSVLTLHNLPPRAGSRAAGSALAQRWAVRRADVVLAAASDLQALARRLGAADVRYAPVAAPPLPPPGRTAAHVRAELGAAGRPLVLAVGRLHPQKGFDVLVEAAARWHRQPVPLVAVAGTGPDEAALRARVAALGAPVRLLGHRDDVADLLAAADVVVLPSRWEARALLAQEALRAGRPLVATAVGGTPALVGDGAQLIAPEDPAALAAAVDVLLADPAAAAALGARGRLRAAQWPDESAMLDQVVAVYRQLAPVRG